jgi:signal transduction histidine kinase
MVRTEKLAAIGRLSAGLAHEIGNPLSIVLGYVDLLRRADLSTEEREVFSKNSQLELDRIKTLIRQLLDFSRSDNLQEHRISVNDLIKQVIGFVGMEKSFARCNIIQQLDAGRDMVIANADSLRQVLLNCLLNAVDSLAGGEGSGEIVVCTRNSEEELMGGSLFISLKDNGKGIAAEHLENVFDPFFTTKEPGKGTGLGLFVCHTIIERLGGSITIGNNPYGEKGSEVVITLPLMP